MEKYGKLLDRNFNEFKDRVYENGILKLKLSSWDQFHKITQIFLNNKADYFWRGHQDESWELKSLFDREISKKSSKDVLLTHISKRQDKLKEILKIFDQKLKEILPDNVNNIDDDDEKWAIGQHYGLPTPLLDWTVSPHIAAFIAFRKKCKKNQSENRVIYALNIGLQRLINKNKLKLKNHKTGMVISSETTSIDRFVDFLDLTETCDDMQNLRLKAQQGRFTKALNGIDIKTNISNYVARNSEILKDEKVILAEILIPEKERDNCLKYLNNTEYITHGKLFPDYPGAVEICKDYLYEDRD